MKSIQKRFVQLHSGSFLRILMQCIPVVFTLSLNAQPQWLIKDLGLPGINGNRSAVSEDRLVYVETAYEVDTSTQMSYQRIKISRHDVETKTDISLVVQPEDLGIYLKDSLKIHLSIAGNPVIMGDTDYVLARLFEPDKGITVFLIATVNGKLARIYQGPVAVYDYQNILEVHNDKILFYLRDLTQTLIYTYSSGRFQKITTLPYQLGFIRIRYNSFTDQFLIAERKDDGSDDRKLTLHRTDGSVVWTVDFAARPFLYSTFDAVFSSPKHILLSTVNAYYNKYQHPYIDNNYGYANADARWKLYKINAYTGVIEDSNDITAQVRAKKGRWLLQNLNSLPESRGDGSGEVGFYFNLPNSVNVPGMSFLIADSNLQIKFIRSYETELKTEGLTSFYAERILFADNSKAIFGGESYVDSIGSYRIAAFKTQENFCLSANCETRGCTNPAAYNYDPDAKTDDGSCVLSSCGENFREINFSSTQTFAKVLDEQKAQPPDLKIRITGSVDGITYLDKSISDLCRNVSFSQNTNTVFFNQLEETVCLPRDQPCYRMQFYPNVKMRDGILFMVREGFDHYQLMYIPNSTMVDTVHQSIWEGNITIDFCGDANTDEVQVYPNPSDGFINVQFPEIWERVTATLYNTLGELMFQQTYSAISGTTLDISSLTPGIYFLKLQNESNNYSQVFRIQKL
ncbi:MAG: T9SS type A sorting domain-containing protein [Bacteroidetes bacterium]|nr:T9SS type A sorting domain-containing protein [Bacteroidota bacterium]